jgi:antitoxin ParD1/3/4
MQIMAKTTSFVLGETFEAFVAREVASGEYSNASEVIRDALRVLKRRKERHARELELIDEAEASGISSLSHEEIWAKAFAKINERKRTDG